MRISLGLRVLTLIAAINVVVFAAGLYFLTERLSEDRLATQQEFAGRLLYTLQNSFNDHGDLRVEQILRWPYWEAVPDAVIVDRNPDGVSLNPVGALSRNVYFDRQSIEDGLAKAIRTRSVTPAMDGLAFPIRDSAGEVWGGCWFRVQSEAAPVWLGLLPWFFVTTLLLFLGAFSVLRRYVLQPVQELAEGARRVAAGEHDFKLQVPGHSDELSDLILNFNSMSADVHRFHTHLEDEVEAATRLAYEAEAAAMRQRRLAAMGELAAGIAHEINNPLGGMLNAVDVLDRDSISVEKRNSYHGLLRGGLERIQATVTKLLRFTPHQAERGPLDLKGPARDAIELVRHRAQEHSVQLREEFSGDSFLVLGQSTELGQAVLNLLVNSLDVLEGQEAAGCIEVRLETTAQEVILSVLDNGPGVEEAQLERVADLFYTTKEVGRGTGLGLALVHNVVAAHGGRVLMGNQPDGGLRVELHLPRIAERGEGQS